MPPLSCPARFANPEPLPGTRRSWLGAGALVVVGWSLTGPTWAQPASAALSIGVLPNVSARVLLASYQPMREYFERALRQPVTIVTAPDFRAFAANSLKGEYDIVVTAPNLGRVMQLARSGSLWPSTSRAFLPSPWPVPTTPTTRPGSCAAGRWPWPIRSPW